MTAFHRPFSERVGVAPTRTTYQIGETDDALRNSLWNQMHDVIFGDRSLTHDGNSQYKSTRFREYANSLWSDVFKEPVDDIDYRPAVAIREIKTRFFGADWVEHTPSSSIVCSGSIPPANPCGANAWLIGSI